MITDLPSKVFFRSFTPMPWRIDGRVGYLVIFNFLAFCYYRRMDDLECAFPNQAPTVEHSGRTLYVPVTDLHLNQNRHPIRAMLRTEITTDELMKTVTQDQET